MSFDPLKIRRTLAADCRFGELDLTNDQVWELVTTGNPAAITMRTSFGLRCSDMRIYPQFTLQGITLTDPHSFASQVKLLKRRSNYLLLEFDPFTHLNVRLEFWVPSSQALCGRFKVTNFGSTAMNLIVNWVVALEPLDQGEHMSAMQMGVNTVLQGKSGNLHPVFFLTGGPEPLERAHPSLQVKMILAGGASRQLSWTLAALDSTEASFSLARQSTSLPWDIRSINEEMLDRTTLFEFSGDSENNFDLLNETQIKAQQLLVPSSTNYDRLSFITRRQPDGQNYLPVSSRQDLISFSQINAYDAWMISRLLLPANPQPLKEIIQDFINFQQDDGSIPWAISASGSASSAKTPPLLAGIVHDVDPFVNDREWLHQVFSPLVKSLKAWFSGSTKTIPTWENSLQTGLDNHPLYTNNDGLGLGMEPGLVHNPGLDAMLYHECVALTSIARSFRESDALDWLERTAENCSKSLDACWDNEKSCFTYRDIQTGEVYHREVIHEFKRNGSFKIQRKLSSPRRFCVSVQDQITTNVTIYLKIIGRIGENNLTEEVVLKPKYTSQQAVTKRLFDRLESVEISGLPAKWTLTLGIAGNDAEDITLLLPLWSGAMSPEKIELLIKNTLLPRYFCPSGLLSFPVDKVPTEDNHIVPFWNNLIIEGLISCDRRVIAGEIQTNLLNAQIKQWQKNGFVSSDFTATDLTSKGELDTLAGLPAIYTLLQTAGIEKIVANEIIFNGLNENFLPFTVKYKGTSIEMKSDRTVIRTLRNQMVEITESIPCKAVLP
jgi:hypothetical protein